MTSTGSRWIVAVLVLAVAFQFAVLVKGEVVPMAARLRQVRGLSAVERSARLAFGDEFADYMAFLREVVPAHATLILPPRTVDIVLGDQAILQYYLFPRHIDNCGPYEVEACVLRATGADTYLLSVQGFPPPELAEQTKRFTPFVRPLGVYAPQR